MCASARVALGHLRERLARCSICCLSALTFLGQLSEPDSKVLRIESASAASLSAALLHAFTHVSLAAPRFAGPLVSARAVVDASSARELCLAFRSPELGEVGDRMEAAALDENASLAPHHAPCLSFALRTQRAAPARRLCGTEAGRHEKLERCREPLNI